jgi:DNA-binding GntR family transcriptional regulator
MQGGPKTPWFGLVRASLYALGRRLYAAGVVDSTAGAPPESGNGNATESAIRHIREAIILGKLRPGERLKETELANMLGLSRTPVREALRVLDAEGLIETSPKRGASVREYGLSDLRELYQLRAAVEGYCTQVAAERAQPEDLQALAESCARFAELKAGRDFNDLVQENLRFHSLIQRAAHSDRLASFVRQVIDVPLVYRSYVWYSDSQKFVAQFQHEQILHALEARDPQRAELTMRVHVLEQLDFLIKHREETHPAT